MQRDSHQTYRATDIAQRNLAIFEAERWAPASTLNRINLHYDEVVGAHRLTAIGLSALRSLFKQPIAPTIEAVERIAGGVTAVLFQNRFGFAVNDERIHFL